LATVVVRYQQITAEALPARSTWGATVRRTGGEDDFSLIRHWFLPNAELMIFPEVTVYAERTLAIIRGSSSSLHSMAAVSCCDTAGPIFDGAE